ncbi:hypothetical protein [Amnibacterium sp.]|uniref:hypothetical protein n=1 Tax=Amnibacterium sp. TaxID=1872496 RepID=UPI0026363B14|nr:hypothetical protein [Amnibacterium sp.]MCU1472134.1 hypothetical protein [Amnibacterium sp.]
MRSRSAAAAVLGLAALGLLSGCSATESAATAAPAGPAKDGTYRGAGDYETPGGPESVTVTLTVRSGIVRAVQVTGSGTTPNAQHYEAAFESGISGVVVGKKLAGLTVGAVSGSSLTGQGFDAALDAIRREAAS